jgi:hypothetical protein
MSKTKTDDELWASLLTQPPPGSWADVARMMASLGGDDGMDGDAWDRWKDEMKDTDGEGY